MRQFPQTAATTDWICIIFFLSVLIVVLPFIASFGTPLPLLFVLSSILFYIIRFVIIPLYKSKSIDLPQEIELPNISGLRFRESSTLDTRVIDLWFRRYVIFSSRHLHGYHKDWRSVIWHELAHVKNRDAMFFHFVGISGLLILSSLAITFFWLFVITMDNPAHVWLTKEGYINMGPIVILSSVLPVLIFVLWIRRSLHLREYRADAEALRVEPVSFSDWLRRNANFEQDNPKKLKDFTEWILNWVTHPSFQNRKETVSAETIPTNGIIWREALRSLGLLTISVFIAYTNFQILQKVDAPQGIDALIALAHLFFMILAFIAGFAAISLSTMEIINQASILKGFLFTFGFAVATWLAIFLNYGLAVLFGYYETMTSGLPDVPPEEMNCGADVFASILLSGALTVFLLNYATHHFFPSWRYSFFLHMVIGFLMFLGAFLITKALYAMLS